MKNLHFILYGAAIILVAVVLLSPLLIAFRVVAVTVVLCATFVAREWLGRKEAAVVISPTVQSAPKITPPQAILHIPIEQISPDSPKLRELGERVDLIASAGLENADRLTKVLSQGGANTIDARLAEFDSVTRTISDNVLKTFNISDNLSSSAKQAFELSEKVRSGIESVTASLTDSIKDSQALFEQSRMIQRIVDLMGDVSAKTHVLSINASIVSARAGLQGKAFDVVAREIRGLAHETERSLGEIENVIRDVQSNISSVTQHAQAVQDQTASERQSLISVAGALQGAILAVEVIRTVANVTQESIEAQTASARSLKEEIAELERRVAVNDSVRGDCATITDAFSSLQKIGLELRATSGSQECPPSGEVNSQGDPS